MTETRKSSDGRRVASFSKNASSSHSPAHRYSVTLTKTGRVKETTFHRHVRTQVDARALAKDFTT